MSSLPRDVLQNEDRLSSIETCQNPAIDPRVQELIAARERIAAPMYHLRVLRILADSLNRADDLDSLVQNALRLILQLLDIPSGWMFLIDEQGDFQPVAMHGLPSSLSEDDFAALRWSPCACQERLLRGDLVFAVNIFTCERLAGCEPDVEQGPSAAGCLRHHASVPLSADGVPLGILNLLRSGTETFTQEELNLLSSIGEMLSVAIRRAQLHQQAEDARLQEREALLDFSRALLGLTEPRAVAEAAGWIVQDLLKVELASLMALDPSGQRLVLVGGSGWESSRFGRFAVPLEGSREGEVFRSGKSAQQMAADGDDPLPFPPELRELGVKSSLTVPLQAGGEVIGTLCAHSLRARRFSPGEARLLALIANLTAAAFDRSRHFRAAQDRVQEAETLRRSAAAVAATLDQEEILERILEELAAVIPHDSASVQLLRDGYLEIVGGRGWEKLSDVVGLRFAVPGDNPNTVVLQTGRPLILGDAPQEYSPFTQEPHSHIRSWLGVPLIVKDNIIGMLALDSVEPGRFTAYHARLVSAYADHVAIALENARLFQETARKALHMQALAEAAHHLLGRLNFEETLERVMQTAMTILEVDRAAVFLLDPDSESLHCPAAVGLSAEYIATVSDHYRAFPGSASITGRQPLSVRDAQTDPRLDPMREIVQREGFRSYCVLPLIVNETALGALVLYRDMVRPFDQEALALAQALADHAAIALDRARHHEAVKEAESRYRKLFDEVPVGLYRSSPDGAVLDANAALVEMLGFPDKETLQKANAESIYVDPQERAQWCQIMERDGVVINYEERLRRHDGKVIWVHDSARAIRDPQGEILYYEGSLEDVTDHKRGELALRQSHDRLEQALAQLEQAQKQLVQQERLAAIGQLAAGIAHDFNNIMGAILLYAELLLPEPALTDRGRERLDMIISQVRRAASLTEQILDFSRKSVLKSHAISLSQLVHETARLLERTLPENIHIDIIAEDELPVRADPARMQQVLTNLALNARDAMSEGGLLRVELDLVHVEPADGFPFKDMAAGKWVKMTVSDTGSGIAPDVLPRIFEPFFTTKPPGEGTGLGLAQVYGIIKQHGGYIDVHSEEGQGTTFVIFLPALEGGMSPAIVQDEHDSPNGRGERILIVEDDDAIREALNEILAVYNFNVLTATGGQEALEIFELQQGEIDLVMTDLIMPGMGGTMLCRELGKRWPQVPIVVMTGYPLGIQTRELFDRNNITWIQKPLRPETVVRAIREALGG